MEVNPYEPEDRERLDQLELETLSHHHDADVGYEELREDSARSLLDDSYVTLAVDMQSVC
jgi:hypothetical protein